MTLNFRLHVWVAIILFTLNSACATAQSQGMQSEVLELDDFANPKDVARALKKRGWLSFTHPENASAEMGLHFNSPYQAGKIPVVFVHGMFSDVLTWHKTIDHLKADPAIANSYRFWTFQYATGNSYLQSAAKLRADLAATVQTLDPDQTDVALDNMVLVGHSMGGLIAKLQVSHSETTIWDAIANVPLETLAVSAEERVQLESVVLFKPLPFINRVVFIGTPHQGVHRADLVLGKLGRRMVEFPENAKNDFTKLVDQNAGAFKTDSSRLPTSIDHISPRSPILIATNKLRLSDSVQFHSIIGTGTGISAFSRGDGFVSKKSSTLNNAASELRVRAKHRGLHGNADSVFELKRILMLHRDQVK